MTFDRAHFVALQCPPTPVTWSGAVRAMFTQDDADHMKHITGGRLDLSDYESVTIWAVKIYEYVESGLMPPVTFPLERRWTPDMVNTFGCWIQQGCQP